MTLLSCGHGSSWVIRRMIMNTVRVSSPITEVVVSLNLRLLPSSWSKFPGRVSVSTSAWMGGCSLGLSPHDF